MRRSPSRHGATTPRHGGRPIFRAWPALAFVVSACTAGPDYKRPPLDLPASWRTEAPWRLAAPADAAIKGEWWALFGDPELDRIERAGLAHSPTIAIAGARLEQARQVVRIDAAALYPQVAAGAGADRARISANRPLAAYNAVNTATTQNEFTLGFSVRYETDLFGRNRRQLEAGRAALAGAAADFENARLVLAAEVAADYFTLRELDLEIDIIRQSIGLQRRALDLVVQRHDLGAASGLDVAQQQASLDATTTQIELLANQRAQFEHALAALVGEGAPGFGLPVVAALPTPPNVPIGVPSDLLERRPDVASAERAMAAANAQIGVAKAAFFPSVNLAAGGGWDSRTLGALLNAPSVVWSLGVSATQSLFDAGHNDATVRFATAGYAAAVGNYRQAVLGAMQEVQDGISGLAILGRAQDNARAAVASAERTLSLANERYAGGLATYLDVINAQQAVLGNQRQAAQIAGQQILASVFLVKAVGGGWDGLAATVAAH
ncbi:MAG TPA: efflux transporter outer membrane subunit [Burkholderiaceae bacterium]|nr:efflux transporter outer membrane subunit [Burkholderiaceae bacterium]